MTRRKLLDTHYRKKDLLERGWTRGMIDRHLGEPDLTSPWNYSDICWYEHGRVHRAEQQEEVQEELTEEARRREAWRAAEPERIKRKAERRRAEEEECRRAREAERRARAEQKERDLTWLKSEVPGAIHVQVMASEHLERMAAASRYGRFPSKETGLVAYVRHELTNYDELRRQFDVDAYGWRYAFVKTMILDAIGDCYPWLKEECRQQITKLQSATRYD